MRHVAGPTNLLLQIKETALRRHDRARLFAVGAALLFVVAVAAVLVLA